MVIISESPIPAVLALQIGRPLEKTAKDARYASTLGKGLIILRAFTPSDGALGNREISRRTGFPSATVSRLTYTLAQHGFLIQQHPSEAFKLGPAAIAVGYTAREGFSFFQQADPIMQDLAEQTSTLVAVCVQDESDAIMARIWRPTRRPSIWLSEGHRLPLDNSAPGRALLASRPVSDTESDAIMARIWRPTRRPSIWLSEGHRLPLDNSAPGRALLASRPVSDTDSDAIKLDRQTLIARGFVTSIGGWNREINACATPFSPDPMGLPFAFLCGALGESLGEPRLLNEVGPALLSSVTRLKAAMGLA